MMYGFIPFLIFLDLGSKYLAKIYLENQKNIDIIGNFFQLSYHENIGIAFSVPITGNILKVLTLGIITYLTYYYFSQEKKKQNTLIDFSFIFIFSGAIGNGYERIWNEKVIDFFSVQYFSIFNLADVWITIGAIFYIIALFKKNKS